MKKLVKSIVKTVVGVATLATAAALIQPPVATAAAIKVGALVAQTGPSFLGIPEANTLKMLVDEINAKGGVNGNTIELIIKDSAGEPEKAVSFAKQLIEEEKVFAIIGPSTSGETLKIKSICEEGKTPLLSMAAAELIVDPVAKYVFKTPQKDSHAATIIFEDMKKKGITKVAVVASNTGFGKAGQKELVELAPKMGIQLVENETFDKATTDLTSTVAKLKANKDVQAVIAWSVEAAQSIVLKNIRQANWDIPIYLSHGFGNIKFVQAAGAAAEGVLFPAGRLLVVDSLPDTHPQKALLAKYKKEYEAKFNEDVSTFGGHAWDAIMIFTKALETAGPDKDKVRDAIENIKNFVGTAGTFNFSPTDHNGLTVDAFALLTIKDGKFVPYAK